MNDKITRFNLSQRQSKDLQDLKSGDIIKVYRKIVEGKKERTQVFEGMIIAVKGRQSSSPMITVRKVTDGVGVELVMPVYSPGIEKIDLVKRAKVRRSKLYYIRDKSAKSLRLKYKDMSGFAKVEDEDVNKALESEEAPADEATKKDESQNKEESSVEEEKSESETEKKEDAESGK